MLTAGQVRLFMKKWKIRMYLSAVLCMWHSENSLSSQFLPASLFETGSVLFRACMHQASWTTSFRRLPRLCFPVTEKMHWNWRCLGYANCVLLFSCGFWSWDSGAQTCRANALATEPSSQPQQPLKRSFKNRLARFFLIGQIVFHLSGSNVQSWWVTHSIKQHSFVSIAVFPTKPYL